MKKFVCLLLALVLTLSLAACGNKSAESESGVKTIVVAIPTMGDMTYAQDVQDAINAISEERYGISYDLEFITYGNWAQQVNLLLTGDEVDIVPAFMTPLSTYVKNGQFADLTEYVANASEDFKNDWPDEVLKTTSLNGSVYAIPNLKNYGSCYGLTLAQDVADFYGIENRHQWTLAEVSDFLYQAQKDFPDRYALVPSGAGSMVAGWSWDGLGDSKYIGVLPDCGQSLTVENLFDTDDFQELAAYTRQWYLDGLTIPDVLNTTEGGHDMLRAGKACATFSKFANGNEAGCVLTTVVPAWSESNAYNVTYGVNANAKDVDTAWKALEVLYTDEEIIDFLVQGIEGKTYVVNDNNTISYIDGKNAIESGYCMPTMYWVLPNADCTLPIDAYGEGFFEGIKAFNDATLKSKASGFYFDITEVADQYTACSNVMDKYMQAILSGSVDTEATIAQANKELEAAGINDIITAKQAQLDAFLGN